jgi:hypothetical protein
MDTVQLYPNGRGAWAGRELDVADMNGDGCDEVLASADWSHHPNYRATSPPDSFLYLLRSPSSTGPLDELAAVRWDAQVDGGGRGIDERLGQHPVLLPSEASVAVAGILPEPPVEGVYHLHPLPAELPSRLHAASDWSAYVCAHDLDDTPEDEDSMGVPYEATRCETDDGPALCVFGELWGSTITERSGHMLVYDLPVTGPLEMLGDARSWLRGDPLDDASNGIGGQDLDGDGRGDLVIAAYGWSEARGRLAIFHDIPVGTHRLWDVADATLSGEVAGGELGLSLAVADVDQDGFGDILAGAPLASRAYLFLGPFSGGDRTVAEADATFEGPGGDWFGRSGEQGPAPPACSRRGGGGSTGVRGPGSRGKWSG